MHPNGKAQHTAGIICPGILTTGTFNKKGGLLAAFFIELFSASA